jgi:hypothetical protein
MILRIATFIIGSSLIFQSLTLVHSEIRPRMDETQFSCTPERRTTTTQDTPCPVFEVQCPDSQKRGDAVTFKVPNLSGVVYTEQATYKWKVSGAKIIRGQGTSSIVVDTQSQSKIDQGNSHRARLSGRVSIECILFGYFETSLNEAVFPTSAPNKRLLRRAGRPRSQRSPP